MAEIELTQLSIMFKDLEDLDGIKKWHAFSSISFFQTKGMKRPAVEVFVSLISVDIQMYLFIIQSLAIECK